MIRSIFRKHLGRKGHEICLGLIAGLLGLLFLFMPSGVTAGSALTINQINIERFPEIRIYLTASDERGNPLWGLNTARFSVQEDGSDVEVRKIVPLGGEKEPLSVVLAIDRSGSMKGQPIKDALKAAKGFIREMRAIDQVGVISFDDHVTVVFCLSSDKDALYKAIGEIRVGRDTALNDAIMGALEMLSSFKGRRAVVVLTDGKENRSKASREEAVQEAIRIGVPVITVGLGDEVNASALKDMADKSGGRVFFAKESGELPDLYRVIARQLINQYRVTIKSSKSLDGGWHRLRMEVNTVQGKAEVERLYLATLSPILDTSVLGKYRKKTERNYLIKIGFICLVVVLALAIIFTGFMRYKKTKGARR